MDYDLGIRELVYYCADEDTTLRGQTFEELLGQVKAHLRTQHQNERCHDVEEHVRTQMKIVY